MLSAVDEKFGRILISEGLLTEEELAQAIAEHGRQGGDPKPLGAFLAESGLVSDSDVLKVLGIQFNLPVMELEGLTVDPAVLKLVPEPMARRFKVMPLYLVEKELTVALSDPTHIFTIDTLANQTRCQILPVLALEQDILRAIGEHYGHSHQAPAGGAGPAQAESSRRLESADPDGSIVQIVDGLLLRAIQEGASDVHVESRKDKLSVRFRVDGVLKEYETFPHSQQMSIVSRLKVMAKVDISERFKPQDGRMKLATTGKEVDVRVSTLPTYYGEEGVMRLLDQQKVNLNLDELGFSPRNLEILRGMITQPYGLILVTGPTGSGKSTTLYASLNAIKSEEINIVTVEDPVEYQIPLINQVQVNLKKDLTFATALRSILRQDPNVIMIGEIRDPESGQIATDAALTGHLVLSTLHTNDAPSSVIRLGEMGVEPFLLAPSLIGIVAQRLARRVCPACKETYVPSQTELARLGMPDAGEMVRFSRGRGCPECKETGYKGRVPIHEILVADETIRGLITEKGSLTEVREYAAQSGFVNMRLDAIRKVVKGMTTTEEVLRVTRER